MVRSASGLRGLNLAGATVDVIALSFIVAGPLLSASVYCVGKLKPFDGEILEAKFSEVGLI